MKAAATQTPSMINRRRSVLLMVDFQQRLMPAIHDSGQISANAGKLLAAAELLQVPVLFTEQNPQSLGRTIDHLASASHVTVAKAEFDAASNATFARAWPPDRDCAVVAGCEAHVCVLQTALGLMNAGRSVFIVADAVGSRHFASKAAALDRLRARGADIVTTEMVIFEWLETAAHPYFKDALALIK